MKVCVGDLIRLITRRIAKNNRELWFRGQRCASWDVEAFVWRQKKARYAERDYTNRFRARAASRLQAAPRYGDLATWLSLMQHYGLPTRLLDWTRSPLIALYAALESYIYDRSAEPVDAAVWVLEPHVLNNLEVSEKVTPAIDAVMCEKMLRPAFSNRYPETHKILAVMAAEKDIRMFVQQGCFTIHSDRTALNCRPGYEQYLSRITIPARAAKTIALEVDVSGFRKGDLFPDLGHLADELKSHR